MASEKKLTGFIILLSCESDNWQYINMKNNLRKTHTHLIGTVSNWLIDISVEHLYKHWSVDLIIHYWSVKMKQHETWNKAINKVWSTSYTVYMIENTTQQ